MRLFLVSLLAVFTAIVPLVRVTDAASLAAHDRQPVMAVDDPALAIPSPEEVKAAFTLFNVPTITNHELPDNDPLWDLFDEAARFTIPPEGDLGEVAFIVAAYNVEAGDDEKQDFAETLDLVKAYGAKRVAPGGAVDVRPVAAADMFGANEAADVLMVKKNGNDRNVMLVRLARFGNTITFVSTDVSPKADTITDGETMALAIVNITMSKLVADKVR